MSRKGLQLRMRREILYVLQSLRAARIRFLLTPLLNSGAGSFEMT